jgi:hypothetical protein
MEKDENDLMNTFKVAANSLALLYKESHNHSRKSYMSGYQQALQDLWEFISLQQSTGPNSMIPTSDVLSFIQSRHMETERKPVQEEGSSAVAMPPFQQEFSEVASEGTSGEFSESLKRRWGLSDGSKHMNIDDIGPSSKRPRSRGDRMSD